ncbi:MAG: cytochrome b/b6 domain-containing protein [Gammaproteobacteria bacterium]|nr:cytochrome b/b6 domain-containing protein [Gammaproteobacteria bacterium]
MKTNGSRNHRAFCFLHWAVVLLVCFLYATGYYRLMFTTQSEPLNWYLLVWHMNAGALVVVLTLLLFVSKLISPIPTEKSSKFLIKLTTNIVRLVLYAMLLVIPLTAYIGLGFDFPLLGLINVPGLMRFPWVHQWESEHKQMSLITFMEPFAQFHRDTGADMVLPVLLGLHIGAAFYHHFVLQDTVLIRLLPSLQRKPPENPSIKK